MSERIQGLSISLDLETAGVERSLSQIKNSFSSLRRSAQVNMNNLKFDSKDITTYQKHVDELSDSYDKQKQNVEDVEKRMNQMKETGKDNTEEFKKLNAEYNKQVDELNKLGHVLDQTADKMHDLYVENNRFTKMSGAFDGISRGLGGVSQKLHSFGDTMTRRVTMPIMGVITAAGGITAAFGWSRLVAVDTAQAQLKGLGYDTEDVGRITEQVTSAIEGGMTTMAEGTAIAAGAMAAGVEEGEELERYIKLVGDAAVGANRPVNEMASIFNRVQGSGKLMTQELNMIEDGMPGFAQAMADSMGVSQEEFRNMVTAGEVSSEDFLNVMDDFAGGMAEAYADSWQGMLANTKAYIGIIGENLLGGVFEQSKESIGEFIELLSSEEAQEWAADMGVKIGDAFSGIVDSVREGINWFRDLSAEKQKLIGVASLVVVGIGPLAKVLAIATGALSTFAGGISSVTGWLGRIGGGLTAVLKGTKSFATVFPKLGLVVKGLGAAFSVLTGPIGLAIAAIIGIGTAFTLAYRRSETFRGFIQNIGGMLKNAWDSVVDFGGNVKTAFEGIFAIFKGDHTSGNELLRGLGLSESAIDTIFLAIHNIKSFFEDLKETAQENLERIKSFFIDRFNQIKSWWDSTGQGIFDSLVETFNRVKDDVSNALSGVKDFFISIFEDIGAWWDRDGAMIFDAVGTVFENAQKRGERAWSILSKAVEIGIDIITGLVETFAPIVQGIFDVLWPTIVYLTQTAWDKIKLAIGIAMDLVQGIISGVSAIIEGDWSRFGEILKETTLSIRDRVVEFIGNMRDRALELFNNLTGGAVDKFIEMRDGVIEWVLNLIERALFEWQRLKIRTEHFIRLMVHNVKQFFLDLWQNVTDRVSNIRKSVVNRFTQLRDRTVEIVTNLYNRVRDWFLSIYNTVRDRTRSARNTAVNWFGSMRDRVIEIAKYIWEKVSGWFSSIYTAIHDKMRDAKNKAVGFAEDLYTGAKEQFESLVDGARDMMDGIGDWIDTKRQTIVDKATALGRGIANAAIRGFNSLIGGINKVAEFLGAKTISKIPLLGSGGGSTRGVGAGYHAIRASKGLRDHKGGDVLVGDKGPGNSIGGGSSTREIVQLPDGKNFLMDGNVLLPNAPRGMKVHSNKNTEAILASNPQLNPDLTGGSGALNNMLRPVTRMLENQHTTAKVSHDVTSDIMAYADDPAQLAKDVIDQFTSFDLPKVPFDMAWAGVRNTTTAMGNKFKEWFDAFGSGGDGSHILGKKILQTFGLYRGNIGFNLGKHYGLDTAHKFDPLISPVNGRVSRIWNDYGGGKSLQITTDKYIWWFMHLSNIMKRVGDTVKTGMRLGTTGNSGNYVVGSGHLHTQVHPRSKGAGNFNAIDPLPVLKGLSGHKLGGYIQRGGLFNLHDDEFVINPNHPTEAMKLIALAGKKLAGKSKQTRELPNPGRSGNDNSVMERLLEKTIEQNQILMQILNKDTDVILDGDSVKEKMDERDYNDDLRRRLFSGKKRGVTVT